MYQSERMNEIIKILRQNHYVTVNHLVKQIRYSPASIRRDLTLLEKQGLVKRTYGGVELKEEGATPFKFRQHSMKLAKNSIAKIASTLINDNYTVFIDGSTTAQYLAHYITEKKNLTVITNNMMLAVYLNEHGVTTYCTGGYVNEIPGILTGEITNNTYSMFHADLMFFSTAGFANESICESSEAYAMHHKAMLKNSDKHVYLCGSDKLQKKKNRIVCSIDEIDYFISDGKLSQKLTSKHKKTKFICVNS